MNKTESLRARMLERGRKHMGQLTQQRAAREDSASASRWALALKRAQSSK